MQPATASVQRPKKRRRLRTQEIESGAKLAEGDQFGALGAATDTKEGDRPRKKKKRRPEEASHSQDRVDDSVRVSYQEDGTILGDEQVQQRKERTQKPRKKKRQSQSSPLDELDKERGHSFTLWTGDIFRTCGVLCVENLQMTDTSLTRQLPPGEIPTL